MAKTLVDFSTQQAVVPGGAPGRRQHHPALADGLPALAAPERRPRPCRSTARGSARSRSRRRGARVPRRPHRPARHALRAVAQHEDSPFYWLHSVDDPSRRAAGHEPVAVLPGRTRSRVSDEDAARARASTRPSRRDVFCVVRAADELEDFTVNLRRPDRASTPPRRLGRQVINEAGGYVVRAAALRRGRAEPGRACQPDDPVVGCGHQGV